jgi:ribonuclease P protein component
MDERLQKHEILRKQKLIRKIFHEGSSFRIPGMMVKYLFLPLEDPIQAQVLFVVGKSRFAAATQRNLIKRRMREAYRKNKSIIYDSLTGTNQQGIFLFSYTHQEILSFEKIQEKIIVLLQRLKQENEKAVG